VAGAHAIRDAWPRLFVAPTLHGGKPNPKHLDPHEARALGRAAAVSTARRNGLELRDGDVTFPDSGSFAPTRVEVTVREELTIRKAAAGGVRIPVRAGAAAELSVPAGAGAMDMPGTASGGGYSGPLAYRMGRPMRPDVARAFDSMSASARRDGVTLSVTSGFRSDAEQAKLFAARPDPKWVAPPGTSLHRYGTELDLGPPGAYGWLAANARRFGFIHRYAWEPWHYGFGANPRDVPAQYERGSWEPPEGDNTRVYSGLPSFVPARFHDPIARSALRWNVPMNVLAAQLYAESGFNPFARSPVGARGIAQFMPGTARSYGLRNPFDADAAIDAQGHLMSDLLKQFGSVSLALAAYNAGPGAVQRYNGVPPFAETKAYVARIVGMLGSTADIAPVTRWDVALVE